jgi:hypothetical protein
MENTKTAAKVRMLINALFAKEGLDPPFIKDGFPTVAADTARLEFLAMRVMHQTPGIPFGPHLRMVIENPCEPSAQARFMWEGPLRFTSWREAIDDAIRRWNRKKKGR